MQKSVLGLFRSLLHQILQHFPRLLQQLSSIFKRRYETEGEIGGKWNWQEKSLQDFFKHNVPSAAKIHPIRVFIDALDESGEVEARKLVQFFEAITNSPSSSQGSLSICFSCRHYPLVSLENGFEISVDAENHQDIMAYIRDNIQRGIRDEGIATKVESEVVQKSLGSFQWVVLVIPKIIQSYRKGKWRAIQKYIQDIPSELSQLYHKLVDEIEEETLTESLQLFQWICFAQRPLSLEELRFAMVVDADTPYQSIRECQETEIYAGNNQEMRSRVLDLSRGLAEVQVHEGQQVAQFIHQSVKDYLIQNGLQAMSKCTADSVIGSAHYRLSRSCIRYMSMKELRDYIRDNPDAGRRRKYDGRENDEKIKRKFIFVEYAVTSWLFHAKIAEKENVSKENLFSFVQNQSEDILKVWIELSHMKCGRWNHFFPIGGSNPLHIASQYNFISIVNDICRSNNIDVNSKNDDSETPIHLAAANGHQAVVRSLLEQNGLELNLMNRHGQTALSRAAKNGHEAVIQLLTERSDVTVNSKDAWNRTPLLLAVECGHQAVVQLLIEQNDVDVNSEDRWQRTPLFVAAEKGDETMIKFLLQRNDVDVNSQDIYVGTSLSAAAENGHETVIKLLIERDDVKINLKNRDGQSPLFLAVKNGHETVIKLLLKQNDVDVNSKDSFNQTLLHVAAERGHESIVKLLLTREDIDWMSSDRWDRSPLDVAKEYGREAVVKILESYVCSR